MSGDSRTPEVLADGASPTLASDLGSGQTMAASHRPSEGEALSASVLEDRYEVRHELGRGGMGRVLVAYDRRLKRDVAIKELLQPDPMARERFEREMQVTAHLQHPSIVAIHEAGVSPSGEPFYVMPQVPGRSLAEALLQAPTLAERMALLPQVIAACEAMAYAHESRVIHRDLKPANILVGAFGETVVIDWGLARSLEQADLTSTQDASSSDPALTRVGNVVGTPEFMAPEQARGEAVDARCDVYALGVILRRLLTGRLPYGGGSAPAILAAVVAGPPPEADWAGVPLDLVAIAKKAMAYAREQRYPTAKELVGDLRRFGAGQLVAAHHYSASELLARWIRRHRAVLTVAAAAAVALVALGAVSLRHVLDSRSAAQRERASALAARDEAQRLQHEAEEARQRSLLQQAEVQVTSDPTGTLGLLRQLDPRLPGWEEARLLAEQALESDVATWELPLPDGSAYALFHGSKRVVLGLPGGELRVWDSALGSVTTLGRAPGPYRNLRLANDDRALLAVSTDGAAWEWDLPTRQGHRVAEAGGAVVEAWFLRDGTLALSRAGGVLELWDAAGNQRREVITGFSRIEDSERTGGLVLRHDREAVVVLGSGPHRVVPAGDTWNDLDLSTDGEVLVGWGAAGAGLIDVKTGRVSLAPGLKTPMAEPEVLDGHTLVALVDRRTYAAWEPGGRAVARAQLDCDASAVYALRGRRALFACDDAVELVDLDAERRRLIPMPLALQARFDREGAWLASPSGAKALWLWDLAGHLPTTFSVPAPIVELRHAPGSQSVLAVEAGDHGALDVVDPVRRASHRLFEGPGAIDLEAMAPTGGGVAWTSNGDEGFTWTELPAGAPHPVAAGHVNEMEFALDGTELAVAGAGGVDLVTLASGAVAHLGLDGAMGFAAFTRDRAQLIVADATAHRLSVWTRQGTQVRRLDAAWEGQAQVSPDGRWFINAGTSGGVDVWSTRDWTVRHLLGTPPVRGAFTVLPDSSAVVVGDADGVIWQRGIAAESNRRVVQLRYPARSLEASADSQRVGIYDGLGTATVVDLKSGFGWRLREAQGTFDDLARAGTEPAWLTARGTELRIWKDDLPEEPVALLQRLANVPRRVEASAP